MLVVHPQTLAILLVVQTVSDAAAVGSAHLSR